MAAERQLLPFRPYLASRAPRFAWPRPSGPGLAGVRTHVLTLSDDFRVSTYLGVT